MRIGELARRTGLAPSAIRYYEDRDMFSPGQVVRSDNGYRDYTPAAQQRLELVLAGRAAGFSLEQMRTRMQHWAAMDAERRIALLEEQRAVVDARIEQLARSRSEIVAAIDRLRAAPQRGSAVDPGDA